MAFSEDIANHILSWLPAKAIYRFKSLSKSFSKIFEESTFITKQSENSLAKDDTCIFIQPDMYETYTRRSGRRITIRRRGIVELHPLPRNQPSSGISNDFLESRLNYSARVLSSSNGLILCSTNEHPTKLFICNPVTQSWSSIPNPINHRDPYDDVHDDLVILLECYQGVDDYSLFHFERQTDVSFPLYRCNVYKANEGVWKTMKGGFVMRGGRNLKFDNMPVFLNGLFYIFSAGYPSFLLIYNLENGVTKRIRLPKQVGKKNFDCCARIFKWGKALSSTQSICLVKFDKSVFTIWFLKDNESVSWQKLLKVGVEAMGVKEEDPLVKSYMVMNGDLLVFVTEEKVYSFGLAGERYMIIEEICEHCCGSNPCLVSYMDTLCPC